MKSSLISVNYFALLNMHDLPGTIQWKIKKDFAIGFGLSAACFFILSLYYAFLIVPKYEYMGFALIPSASRTMLTWSLFFCLFGIAFKLLKNEDFLFSIFVLLVFFFFIPNAILFSYGNAEFGLLIANTILLFFFPFSGVMKFKIPKLKNSGKYNSMAIILIALVPFAWIVLKAGTAINFKTLLLDEIYETRDEFSRHISGFANYSFHLLTKCILPVAIVLSLSEKKYKLSLVPVIMLLILYLMSGNKLVYFTTLIVVFFYFTGKSFSGKANGFLLLMASMMLAFPFIDFLLLDQPVMSGTFINRMLFIPALLNSFYFDFFNGQPLWFAESNLFSWFVNSPFDKPAGFVIIEHFWNEEGVYGNNGIISDGFMNAGWAGVIFFSMAFTVSFSFLNSLNLSRAYFGIYFSFVFVFLSAPFFSVFITGGLLLFILLAIAFLRNYTVLIDKKTITG